MKKTIKACIERWELIPEGVRVAVALSGGADSVALLRVLHALDYELLALHVNFHLRGEESDGDEAFVRALCSGLDIPLMVHHADTFSHAEARSISIEMAAREIRYDWFQSVRAQHSDTLVIAVGHNAQDQAETLLGNLADGTGIRGLSGMPYKRHDGIIRPMQDVLPKDIRSYLKALGQSWREDSSNADHIYRRNFIRHQLIPSLEQINPSAITNILRTIDNMREVKTLYLESIERWRNELLSLQGIDIDKLLSSPAPMTLLYELLHPHGFSREQCSAIILSLPNLPSGRRFASSTHEVVRSWGYLEVIPIRASEASTTWTLPLEDGAQLELPIGKLTARMLPVEHLPSLRTPPTEALFDWDALRADCSVLTIRPPQEGERLYPHGMHGSKLISRIMIDRKLSHSTRRSALVLSGAGTPLWLIGITASRLYRLTARSRYALSLTLEPK